MKDVTFRVLAGLVLLAAIVGIGYFAYNAGAAGATTVNLPASGAEAGAVAVPYAGYGMRFWHPFPFFGLGCLGILTPLFLFFLAFGAFRRLLWGPRWGWHHMHHGHWMDREGEPGLPPMFSEWHRRAHGESDPGKKE